MTTEPHAVAAGEPGVRRMATEPVAGCASGYPLGPRSQHAGANIAGHVPGVCWGIRGRQQREAKAA